MQPPIYESNEPAAHLSKMTQDRHFRMNVLGHGVNTRKLLEQMIAMCKLLPRICPRISGLVIDRVPAPVIRERLKVYATKSLGTETLAYFLTTLDEFLALLVGAEVLTPEAPK